MVVGLGCRKDPPAETPAAAEEKALEEESPAQVGPAPEPAATPAAPAPVAAIARPAVPAEGDSPAPATEVAQADLAPEAPAAGQDAPPDVVAEVPAGDGPPPPPPERGRPGAVGAPVLPDLRLLLTVNDIDGLTSGKVALRRAPLVGLQPSPNSDAMMYEPVKGTGYGVGIQLFREDNAALVRDRFNAMLASYPSAQEIAAVSGRTFFAYWEDLLYVGFVQPSKNLVIVLSCGRSICSSDALYELARKVSTRSSN